MRQPSSSDGARDGARVAAVWFPADPLAGAAVAANLAGIPGTPLCLVDADREWSDSSSVLLDELAPEGGPGNDILDGAAVGTGGVRVVGRSPLDPGLADALRHAGGGVLALPAAITAAAAAAEADVLVLGVARSFPSLRRARMALDALPAAHGEIVVVLAEGPPSDLTSADVALVLDRDIDFELPQGASEMAACLERRVLPAVSPRGAWGKAVRHLAERVWPDARVPSGEPILRRVAASVMGGAAWRR